MATRYKLRFEIKSISAMGSNRFQLPVDGVWRLTLVWNPSSAGKQLLNGQDFYNDFADQGSGFGNGFPTFVVGGVRNPDGSPVLLDSPLVVNVERSTAQGAVLLEYLDPV